MAEQLLGHKIKGQGHRRRKCANRFRRTYSRKMYQFM